MLARSAAIFGSPIHLLFFPRMLRKFQTQVTQGQVTRSNQATSPQKKVNVRHSCTEWLITLKLSAIDIPSSIYKMFISEFWYRWHKIRSILRPLHYTSQWEKIERRLFWTKLPLETLSNIGLQLKPEYWILTRILKNQNIGFLGAKFGSTANREVKYLSV